MKFSLASVDIQRIPGFGTVVYTPSVSDPSGVMSVRCEKHGEWIPVNLSLSDDGFSRGDKILQAFKNCPACVAIEEEKAAHRDTRWPNAGEPEGAEL